MVLASVVGKLARGNAAFGEKLVEHLAEAGADPDGLHTLCVAHRVSCEWLRALANRL